MTKTTKPQIWMNLQQHQAYGYHDILVYFKMWERKEDGRLDTVSLYPEDKFYGLYDVQLSAGVSSYSSNATHGHDQTFCDKHHPSAIEMMRLGKFMAKIDKAISDRQDEVGSHDFATTIGALVRFFDVKKLCINAPVLMAQGGTYETICTNTDLFVAKAIELENAMVNAYGKKQEDVA